MTTEAQESARALVNALRRAIGQVSLASALLPDVADLKMSQDDKDLARITGELERLAERAAERAQQQEIETKFDQALRAAGSAAGPPVFVVDSMTHLCAECGEVTRLCDRCGEDHRKLGKTCCSRCGSLLGVDDETGACLGCG